MRHQYASARQFFEAARAAAREAERISIELRAMRAREQALGGGGYGARIRSTPEPDRMAGKVAARIDREAMLEERQEEDYRLIDAACEILYGADNRSGLYALVGWPADAIYHHYLALATWEETAALVGYSERRTYECVAQALDLADANGDMWTRLGMGMAEA